MKPLATQPWIGNPLTDSLFILMPPFICVLLVFLFPGIFQQQTGMSDAWWVVLILLVDVAHVYSTLYKTYFDKTAYQQHRTKLLLIPFMAFTAMVLLYTQSALWFWRLLAYTAVYHFIRQQYGFMRIYSRKEKSSPFIKKIDALTIYASTIYPILFWHLSGNRNFTWFTDNDFIDLSFAAGFIKILSIIYVLLLAAYIIKECWLLINRHPFNLPRNAVVLGTAASWYMGIVYFNGDMAFTLLNVISHGIPYMALVWMYGKKTVLQQPVQAGKLMRQVFSKYGLLLFLGIIFLLAYIEEGLWDVALWQQHRNVFGLFNLMDKKPADVVLAILVPLLALPQVTHYIIDGFIWRINKNDLEWANQT